MRHLYSLTTTRAGRYQTAEDMALISINQLINLNKMEKQDRIKEMVIQPYLSSDRQLRRI